jgi:hypothetical protein
VGEGDGVERGVEKEREPRLPKDRPPPTLAHPSSSITVKRKKTEKRIRPNRPMRLLFIISPLNSNFSVR